MPRAIRAYVRYVESVNWLVGWAAMFLVFVMMGILLYSTITKSFFIPPLWGVELAQFVMTAFYILGGAYAMKLDSHVRMDLLYSRWSPRTRAAVDAVTVVFLIAYVVMLLVGGITSTQYVLEYDERSYSSWAPYMWPIKIIMVVGLVLMLLQVIATFFRNVADALGEPLP